MFLVIALLATVVWAWVHIPPDLLRQIEVGGLVLLLMVALLLLVWFVRRYRLTPEKHTQQEEQLAERQLADETALAVGVRPLALDDLRYLIAYEWLIEYAGFAPPLTAIPARTLVHLALFPWWLPSNAYTSTADSRVPKRAYLYPNLGGLMSLLCLVQFHLSLRIQDKQEQGILVRNQPEIAVFLQWACIGGI
jgi:hypothetical protein